MHQGISPPADRDVVDHPDAHVGQLQSTVETPQLAADVDDQPASGLHTYGVERPARLEDARWLRESIAPITGRKARGIDAADRRGVTVC